MLKKERAKLLYLKLHLCAASGRAHSGHSNSDALNGRGPGGGQTAFGLVTVCAEQAVPCPAGGEATPRGLCALALLSLTILETFLSVH